jgi:hypothetical protein
MKNKIYRVKQDADGPDGIKFRRGEDIQIVRGMVYMGGFPISPGYQKVVMDWINNNLDLFTDIT